MGASNELIARLNLAYVLADMLESCMMRAEELAKRETGQRLEMEQKRYFNAALHNVRMMRKAMNTSNGQEQEDYGNDCDIMLAFLWLLVDRCGEDDMQLYRFYEYVKSFPSVMGFPLMEENEVFGHIFSKKGVGN